MIAGRSVLAVIPARGGSRGVPRKNLRMVAGKPLVAWTIEEGHKSKYIDRLILSSEDPEIIETAKRWGCETPFIRPAHLARDDTPGTAPVLHAVNEVPGYDYVVLLQPTSPLRLAEDIDRCLESCVHHGRPSGVTVTEVDKTPYWMFHLDGDMRLSPVLPNEVIPSRRQEIPPVYALNGAVYVAEIDWFRATRSFVTHDTVATVMPKERSLDIDTEFDVRIADFLLRERTEAGRHHYVHTSS
ncbi:MAG: acylneuraminate cytidylyltransferase family protein [Alicyclobacillus macrosporangiidus]|uniref:acylneuraminate cytidylyltransferase family protein n=1 Tax=Alicyclobacillus macrosporangiidus TaxID=392015 RepID=UPI0026F20F1B|nr:acylneuraminate cytidylyltransferase family protein [Alicyclobacillus macrosporangiidus]MCL6598715.1 acylneuraminate cytidylyltransferase family protein [Alicyclobacillus macrosporangiidus]